MASDSIGGLNNGEGSWRNRTPGEKERTLVEEGPSSSMFACATREGFFIARTNPLQIVTRRGETRSSAHSERVN